mgnify:CR=1 FL=1
MSTGKKARKDLAQKPRGFQDKTADLFAAEQAVIAKVTHVYQQWGFDGLDTGAFEFADSLGKFLPDADRPNEGVFGFQDDETWLALRYDLTAPLARFAAENWQTLPTPYRRYAYGPVWRNEKPGPGRYREFLQCDADTVGAGGIQADAEMLAMAVEAVQAAGAEPGDFQIGVNTRRLLNGVLEGAGIYVDAARLTVLRALDKYDKFGASGVAALLGEGRMDESGDFTKGAGLEVRQIEAVMAYLETRHGSRYETVEALGRLAGSTEEGQAGLAELEGLEKAFSALNIGGSDIVFNTLIVRGLDYYTGPVFEAEYLKPLQDEKGRPVQIGSIGGGGRYDDLIARFTGQKVPATGFSLGVSRLVTAFRLSGALTAPQAPIVVLNMIRDNPYIAMGIAQEIRAAGLRAEAYMGSSGMRAQMKYADRRHAPAVVMAGEDELAKGTLTIKNLALGAQKSTHIETHEEWRESRPGQMEVPRDKLVVTLKNILRGG